MPIDPRHRRGWTMAALLAAAVVTSVVVATDGVPSLTRATLNWGTASGAIALEPCVRNEALFPLRDTSSSAGGAASSASSGSGAKNPVVRWRDTYHSTVSAIVGAHQKGANVQCIGIPMTVASPTLSDLSKKLPPWKNGTIARESDMSAVLMEYLRSYSCALQERRDFLISQIATETGAYFQYPPRDSDGSVQLGSVMAEALTEQPVIDSELALARPTLERTLRYLSGKDRLEPLETSLQCLERTSLDIRNLLGLAADASACMPRVWDTRGSLHDHQ